MVAHTPRINVQYGGASERRPGAPSVGARSPRIARSALLLVIGLALAAVTVLASAPRAGPADRDAGRRRHRRVGRRLDHHRHTDAWRYKQSQPSDPSAECSPEIAAGTSTAELSGLDAGQAYTFKAYSDATCSTELTTDATDAEFTTASVTLTAGNIHGTGATLTMSGHNGAWRYFQSLPYHPLSRCTSVQAGTSTVVLSGLDPNKSYTFKAYLKFPCSSQKELTTDASDAEFTHLPGRAVHRPAVRH